jgi:hypothetical protein
MAENQLADAGSLGDAPDLGDIGERGGHPFELGPSGTVPLEISKVDDLVDQDVGVMGESDQALVHGRVAGEHNRAARGVEPVGESRHRTAVHYCHRGDLDDPVVEDDDRNLGSSFSPGRYGDVGCPDERGGVRHVSVQRHDVEMVGVPGEDALHQVCCAWGRPFRVDRGRAVEGGITGRQRFRPRRPVHADRRERSVGALADAPRIKEHAGQVTDVVGMQVGQEHRFQAGEVESRVGEGGRRSPTAVDNEDSFVDDERRRDPGAAGDGHRRPRRPEEYQFGSHAVDATGRSFPQAMRSGSSGRPGGPARSVSSDRAGSSSQR